MLFIEVRQSMVGYYYFFHLSNGGIRSISGEEAVKENRQTNPEVQITLDTCLLYWVTHPVQTTLTLPVLSPSSW